jgi:iron complex transport system substrate-binding protein
MKSSKCNAISLFLCFFLVLPLIGCSQANIIPPNPQPANSQPSDSAHPVTIDNYDINENIVTYTYKKAPEKVVITHPGATEILLELGLEDHILATVAPYGAPLARIAEKYAKLPIMQAQYDPAQEELLEKQPDMIIGWAHQFSPTGIGTVTTWNERGVATFIMPSTLIKTAPTIENTVYSCISDLGRIFGIQDKADLYIQHSKEKVAAIEKTVKNVQQRKTVLVLQDHSNGTFSIYDDRYLISDMIDSAGGKNICSNIASTIGAEQVLAFDPDFIIFVSLNEIDSTKDLTDEEAVQKLKKIKELQSMRAIQEGNIINLPFFTVNNGGVRAIDGIEKIARTLYPELF